MNRQLALCVMVLCLAPALAFGWWNDDWTSRRQITVDAGVTGADIQETVAEFPLLIRLHGGNFGYFADLKENGIDLRFLENDRVPLQHQIEKVDAFSELALIWVQVPEIHGANVGVDNFWLYYGNGNAADGSASNAIYDASQSLVYHFAEGETMPRDATAYASHAQASKAVPEAAGWIGAAARFSGSGPITVPGAPQLAIHPEQGWTFSAWIKLDDVQQEARVLQAMEGANGLELAVQGLAVTGRQVNGGQTVTTSPVQLQAGKWHHLALVAQLSKIALFLDGDLAASADIQLSAASPAIVLGSGFKGLMDEVQIASTARSPDWIKLSFRSQSPDYAVLGYGPDESNGSANDNHFRVILASVTADGWAVIGLTGIMFIVAMLVMVLKGLAVAGIRKDNRTFLAEYGNLTAANLNGLDGDDSLFAALLSKNQQMPNSPLLLLYQSGWRELNAQLERADQSLSPEIWNLLRVRLDSQVAREARRLNSNMVLLTIAIAGGPFLGLLGTVMGVMITFATIAATGDVNINAIAPGMAAALLATVAGLAVAIPSLFGYNYLLTRIKEIVTDMRVFADELMALLPVLVARKQKESGL